MANYNIADAKAHFSELVQRAMLGEEVIIAKDNKPVLRLAPLDRPRTPRKPGSGRGQILFMAPDFDALPDDFKDYS
jgi:prevent-host-death family protein